MRPVSLTIPCLIYLVVHIYWKPFAQCCANITETVSLATLVAIGVLNVGLASVRSDVSGINQRYFSILLKLEAVFLVIPFFPVFFFFVMLILLQIVRRVILLWKATRTRLSVQGGDESQLLSA